MTPFRILELSSDFTCLFVAWLGEAGAALGTGLLAAFEAWTGLATVFATAGLAGETARGAGAAGLAGAALIGFAGAVLAGFAADPTDACVRVVVFFCGGRAFLALADTGFAATCGLGLATIFFVAAFFAAVAGFLAALDAFFAVAARTGFTTGLTVLPTGFFVAVATFFPACFALGADLPLAAALFAGPRMLFAISVHHCG